MKRYILTPAQMMALSLRNSMMMTEAGMIVSMRMLGMAGMWRVNPAENARMIEEKLSAVTEGAAAASRAMLRGAGTKAIADAALRPARRKTAANMKRLAKLGPGKPT
jgi:hypothetical protein